MKTLLVILLSVFSVDADLALLKSELSVRDAYCQTYELQIDSLRQSVAAGDSTFNTYLLLFEHYASYQFDSALHYVHLLEEAASPDSIDQIVQAKTKMSFVYFSAGLFKEAHDILSQVANADSCSRLVAAEFYSNYARLCLDLGTYAGGSFYDRYTAEGISMIDRQLALLSPQDTVAYNYALALRSLKHEQYLDALHYTDLCLSGSSISDHQRAIAYSSMSYPAAQLGDDDLALHYMIMAAIYDFRSCTKEGVALRYVASMLHDRGYFDEAVTFIAYAQQDAEFYGAKHRQMEVSQILPIIEHEQLFYEQRMRRQTYILLAMLILIVVVLVFLLFYLRKKLKALSEAHRSIGEMNERLSELGRIKEGYIGTFLSWQSDIIRGIDTEHAHMSSLARERDIKALMTYIETLPKQNRRQEFMQRFDSMFLQICPNFVMNFNALLLPEYQVRPKEGELLTTELRIFALIRLGITTNEKIAQVLDYSVNTVYTYKTKMRSRSRLNSDEFYAAAAKC